MLIWVCALHCEAKPVIDFYRLKKSHDDNAFDLYRGENMACIISGMGKLASAAASAWIAARYEDSASIAWINLGVAGAERTLLMNPDDDPRALAAHAQAAFVDLLAELHSN